MVRHEALRQTGPMDSFHETLTGLPGGTGKRQKRQLEDTVSDSLVRVWGLSSASQLRATAPASLAFLHSAYSISHFLCPAFLGLKAPFLLALEGLCSPGPKANGALLLLPLK